MGLVRILTGTVIGLVNHKYLYGDHLDGYGYGGFGCCYGSSNNNGLTLDD